jgi:8-oxo-dGTP diphosphatase
VIAFPTEKIGYDSVCAFELSTDFCLLYCADFEKSKREAKAQKTKNDYYDDGSQTDQPDAHIYQSSSRHITYLSMKHRKHQAALQEIPMTHVPGKYNKRRGLPSTENALYASLVLNVILVFGFLALALQHGKLTIGNKNLNSQNGYNLQSLDSQSIGKEMKWNGGHPAETRPGQCWCAVDSYCMCTPSLAIDLIIASGPDHVWLVRRKDTSQLATMGGFVQVGETVEATVKRELMEEMGIDLKRHQIQLFGVYSDPRRDNRRHTTSAVFAVHLDAELHPHADDDVKDVQRIPLADIEKHEYFADHKTILMDYKRAVGQTKSQDDGDFAADVARSICSH